MMRSNEQNRMILSFPQFPFSIEYTHTYIFIYVYVYSQIYRNFSYNNYEEDINKTLDSFESSKSWNNQQVFNSLAGLLLINFNSSGPLTKG